MKYLFYIIIFSFHLPLLAQVGINTNTPYASLDIKTIDESNPKNNEGLLVPKMDDFPSVNPTSNQDGMLVFITGNSSQTKGFYYWNNNTTNWQPITPITSTVIALNDLQDAKSDGSSVFIGMDAGDNNIGNNNVALGIETLQANTSGFFNVAVGHRALFSNTTGYHNVALGFTAMINNSTGYKNVASGFNALRSNSTGSNNNAVGSSALFNNTIGNFNCAFGNDALRSNTEGNNNIAIGESSLYSNTLGVNNIAQGFEALYSNIDGNDNIAIGNNALHDNTQGIDNIALGNSALLENIDGLENISIGENSLHENKTGNGNIAIGKSALYFNLSSSNIAIGNGALQQLSAGTDNVAIGVGSGFDMFGGSNNILIGQSAEPPNTTGDNQLRLGNEFITYAGVQVAWTVTSDKRYKDNIKEIESGLSFVNKLRPVNYVRKNDENQLQEYGFIAQDVKDILEELGIENHGLFNEANNGMLSLRYNDFIPLLTKAIQEQQSQIKDLKKIVSQLISNQK